MFRLVEALKAENPHPSHHQSAQGQSNSQKSLSELEKTINALKLVIEKLQTENKRLKTKPTIGLQPTASSERLKVGYNICWAIFINFYTSDFDCLV